MTRRSIWFADLTTLTVARGSWLLVTVMLGCATSGPSVSQRHCREILHRLDDQGAVVAARVLDAATGRELCVVGDIDQPLKPASNMKLIVAAIALQTFDPAHRFETVVALDDDDLVIVGCGDPGLGDPVMTRARGLRVMDVVDDWVATLEARGIDEIDEVVYDERALERFHVHPSWWPEDRLEWYGAPIGGLNFNDNCLDITVVPTTPGKPVRYELSTPIRDLVVDNRCLTADAGAETTVTVQKLPGWRATYVLAGQASQRTTLTSVPVDEPGRYLADAVRVVLEERGIDVSGGLRPAAAQYTDAGERVIVAVHASQLHELLTRMNKRSQNLFADALIKIVGREHDRREGRSFPGSWLAGRRAVEEWLGRIGVDSLDLVMVDGSGLSHDNRVTVRLISELLLHMHRHPAAEAFKSSLAVGGVDGTLRRRFEDVPDRVRAKTGTLTGASALSGYLTTDSGDELIFSIIFNRNPSGDAAEALQDEAVRVLIGRDARMLDS